MPEYSPKKATRRYAVNVLGALSIYTVLLVISLRWLHHDPAAPWKYAIAVLPVLPLFWVPVAVIRLFREIDELQKQIQLESLAIGFTGAAALTLTYGFLQNAGLPDVSWIWVWPVMGACWIAGFVIARWRYR